jgi:hypothetical protein
MPANTASHGARTATPPFAAQRRRALLLAAVLAPVAARTRAQAPFDHAHAAWTALLVKHVRFNEAGNASRVDYKGFAADRAALQAYLQSLAGVTPAQYDGWSQPQQFAFLANAYNAFTIEKILTRYPNLKSIRDFGRVIGNPWKDEFFTLLGAKHHLDWIEHERLRAPGVFDEPRVHVAANCASIGCPMLGRAAFTANELDAQLESLMRAFLSDRSRNRYDAASNTLLSPIFDWYKADFERGGKSFLGYPNGGGAAAVAARYADQLTGVASERTTLRGGGVAVKFLEYDWTLNDVAR